MVVVSRPVVGIKLFILINLGHLEVPLAPAPREIYDL